MSLLGGIDFVTLKHKSYIQIKEFWRNIRHRRKLFIPDGSIVCSFVHAYSDDTQIEHNERLPALWHIRNHRSRIYAYPFPRTPGDFIALNNLISGEMPSQKEIEFKKRPRFGFTGLTEYGDYLFAGSWNAVYKINKNNFNLEKILTNSLMCDLHGIAVDDNFIYTCLTGKDTLVISDHEGHVVDAITVKDDLSLVRNMGLSSFDWRFVSKQRRGSCGVFHFNEIQKIKDEIYLTSRCINGFVIVNLKTMKSRLQTINLKQPTLVHDGIKKDSRYYFTSTEGRVLVAENENGNGQLFNTSLLHSNIDLKRNPNWCRGIAVTDKYLICSFDGRYGMGTSFGMQSLSMDGEYLGECRINEVCSVPRIKEMLYLTGFTILKINERHIPEAEK